MQIHHSQVEISRDQVSGCLPVHFWEWYPPDPGTARHGKYWRGKIMAWHGMKNIAIKSFLLGGCRHPDPLLFVGGFQPARPTGGGRGACSPLAQFLRGSASQALRYLVPRSWCQDLGTKILVPKWSSLGRSGGSKLNLPTSFFPK